MSKEIFKDKRMKLFGVFSILVAFLTILNVSFSVFTQSNRTKAANITVGNLEYTITIDGLNNNVIEATCCNKKECCYN